MSYSWMHVLWMFTLFYYLISKFIKRRPLLQVLHDKAVLITGCDSGFGYELAQLLDKNGVTVFAGCLFPEGVGVSQLRQICSNKLHVLHLDVTKDDHVQAAVKSLTCALGANKLWAVVNNAGIATFGEMEWTPMETFKKMFDVNSLGPVRVTKAFLPLLRKSHGRVVIVTSLAGYHVFSGVSAYSMSKFASVALADALRRELRKWSISVHTVSPTLYRTNISKEGNLQKDLQLYWDQLSEDVQHDYGDRFFMQYQETLHLWLKRSRSETKIHEVVGDLLDAVIGQRPKTRYVPGLVAQLHNWMLTNLPLWFLDYAMSFGMPCAPFEGHCGDQKNLN